MYNSMYISNQSKKVLSCRPQAKKKIKYMNILCEVFVVVYSNLTGIGLR
jgi:hypothetical protein